MARGNIYLLVPEGKKNENVPIKLKEKWKFKDSEVDPDTGEPVEIDIHPNWLGAANRLKSNFGAIRELEYQGTNYILIELELSWVEGEMAEVEKLQSSNPAEKLDFRFLTASEAKSFLLFIESEGLEGVDVFA